MDDTAHSRFGRPLPPGQPEGGDDLSFLDDPCLQAGTLHERQEALLFWSHSSLTRSGSLADLSEPARFYEKHTTAFPRQVIRALDPFAEPPAPVEKTPLFEQPAAPAPSFRAGSPPVTPAGGSGNGTAPREPAPHSADPLEDLYEPAGAGVVPAREQTSRPYGDLYAVIMRLSKDRKQE